MRGSAIPNTARLIAECRACGVEMIIARIACGTLEGPDRSLSRKKPGLQHLLLSKDREDSRIVPDVASQGDEMMAIKITDSALISTNPHLTLADGSFGAAIVENWPQWSCTSVNSRSSK